MFTRISASRDPARPISAFAGGAHATTVLSCCAPALLPFLSSADVLPLRAACAEARAAVARHAWADARTPIHGSLAAWAACFPAARAARTWLRPPLARDDLAALRALRDASGAPSLRELRLLGARGDAQEAAARAALPGVRVSSALAGRLVAKLPVPSFYSAASLAVLQDGRLVSGAVVAPVQLLWRSDTWEWLDKQYAGPGPAGRLAALPGGCRIAIAPAVEEAPGSGKESLFEPGLECSTATVWDCGANALVCELKGHEGVVRCVAALPGGRVATGGSDCSVRTWCAASGAPEATLRGHARAVTDLALLSDGSLASCDAGGAARVWALAARACAAELALGAGGGGGGGEHLLAALPGARLASASRSGSAVRLWGAPPHCAPAGALAHSAQVRSLAALAPAGLLASGASDGAVRVWALASLACVAVLRGGRGVFGAIVALAWLPGARLAGAGGEEGDCICVWDLQPGE
jgi:hypothetical protein